MPRRSSTFTVETPEWGATAVAHELHIAKSAGPTSCLVSLAVGGLLQRVGAGRYRLGWRIVALNAVLSGDFGPASARRLRRADRRRSLTATVRLAVWDGGRVLHRRSFPGRLTTSVPPFRIGADLPATRPRWARCCSPAGPGLRSTAPLGSRGGAGRGRHAGLGQVAAQGFAYEEQEHQQGLLVAAPIINRDEGVRVDRHVRAGGALARGRWLPACRGRAVAVHLVDARAPGGSPELVSA